MPGAKQVKCCLEIKSPRISWFRRSGTFYSSKRVRSGPEHSMSVKGPSPEHFMLLRDPRTCKLAVVHCSLWESALERKAGNVWSDRLFSCYFKLTCPMNYSANLAYCP